MSRTTRAVCHIEDQDDVSHIDEEDHHPGQCQAINSKDSNMCPASCPAILFSSSSNAGGMDPTCQLVHTCPLACM